MWHKTCDIQYHYAMWIIVSQETIEILKFHGAIGGISFHGAVIPWLSRPPTTKYRFGETSATSAFGLVWYVN